MNHIHFVFYRLKSIVIYCSYFIYLLTHFFTICICSEIEFIKPSNDVKIQRTTISFTKDYTNRTVFINKMINSGIMRMFTFFKKFLYLIYIFYFVSQVLCICTDDRDCFSMRNIYFFLL
jgi:hypothetical protein